MIIASIIVDVCCKSLTIHIYIFQNIITLIFDCVVYCDQTEVGKTLVLKYIGDVEPKDVRKSLMKQLNPNIIPNRIEKVDKLEKTASGKKQRA